MNENKLPSDPALRMELLWDKTEQGTPVPSELYFRLCDDPELTPEEREAFDHYFEEHGDSFVQAGRSHPDFAKFEARAKEIEAEVFGTVSEVAPSIIDQIKSIKYSGPELATAAASRKSPVADAAVGPLTVNPAKVMEMLFYMMFDASEASRGIDRGLQATLARMAASLRQLPISLEASAADVLPLRELVGSLVSIVRALDAAAADNAQAVSLEIPDESTWKALFAQAAAQVSGRLSLDRAEWQVLLDRDVCLPGDSGPQDTNDNAPRLWNDYSRLVEKLASAVAAARVQP